MINQRSVASAPPPLTPDFIEHPWLSLIGASVDDRGFVHLVWADGISFAAFGPWLAENADGYGLEPMSRESTLDPLDLPSPRALTNAHVDEQGALCAHWNNGHTARLHPGWLHHIATGRHLPAAVLPAAKTWTATDFDQPPTIAFEPASPESVLPSAENLGAILRQLLTFGLVRVVGTPANADWLAHFASAIGPVRDTNFGPLWSVVTKDEPDSTAYTGLALGQHTDLPTREVPPGFQLLHCVTNDVAGGWSRQTDGWAVVEILRRDHPQAFEALSTLEWVFCNRARDAEHRWTGPIIDAAGPRSPLTLRTFYPVRLAPAMAREDIPLAYDALRIFAEVATSRELQIRYPFRPGDLIIFDNRRVLHGRDAFEGRGERHLRGCYIDHDDVYSRLRVLSRPSHLEVVFA